MTEPRTPPAATPEETPGGNPDEASAASLGRASATLAAGTLVSRVLGFGSAAVLAWAIGPQNPGANAFALANQLPNNIYAIVAAGVLSAVLVPQIVRAGLHTDGGQRFVNRLVTLGVVVFLVATAIAVLCAPLLVDLYTVEGGALADGRTLAVTFAYWCLPQIFFYAIYSLLGEVLNARTVFGPFTWSPVLNNVVVIITLLAFAAMFGVDPAHQDPSTWTSGQITLLAGGATVGIAA
ncbi:MAG: lipid II flippase MurJ, partial [Pseudolysinimonas sp.]